MTEYLEEDKPLLNGGEVSGNVSESLNLLSQDKMEPSTHGDAFVTVNENGVVSNAMELDQTVLNSILHTMNSTENGTSATGHVNAATESGDDTHFGKSATDYQCDGNDATEYGNDVDSTHAAEKPNGVTQVGIDATDYQCVGNDTTEGGIDGFQNSYNVTENGGNTCCHDNDKDKESLGKTGTNGEETCSTNLLVTECSNGTKPDQDTNQNTSNTNGTGLTNFLPTGYSNCTKLDQDSNENSSNTNETGLTNLMGTGCANCTAPDQDTNQTNKCNVPKMELLPVNNDSLKHTNEVENSPSMITPLGEFSDLNKGEVLEFKNLEVKSTGDYTETSLVDEKSESPDLKMTEAQKLSSKQLNKSPSDSTSICTWPTQSTLMDFCRICHCEADSELGLLIAPCYCRGSLRYVHQACLQQWIKSSDSKHCELCGYHFLMDSKLKPFHKWKKLSMSTTERRKIMCSVMFHIIAITCVIWSLYVLIERTASEVKVGKLQWPFWTKLVVVAIGFTGGLVFMYVQCKVYFQLWKRLKAFNRVIYVKNNLPTSTDNDAVATEESAENVPNTNALPQQSNEICIVEC